MDILDIDEALKDDSYIFLADKTHDDVSNILQQWKSNNQSQPLQLHPQLPYNNEAFKHNSKTFTRPKRRNLDFSQNGTGMDSGAVAGTPPGMLQLEIGGLVTTNMHKSFLQDTSPPSSICSSMNTERMNNSLITSADFTNLNFLQSTIGLEQEPSLTTTLTNNQAADNNTGVGCYTLSDMIRDRKALESLTMCEDDGTLIKDSHIGQIDEISLTLSKTASGCSTMDNSTDSMSNPLAAADRTMPVGLPQAVCPALQRTLILSEEMIGDTTFNLVDSLTASILPSDADRSLPIDGNATFKRPAASTAVADETQLLTARQMNTTYTEGCDTPEARCETPENVDRKLPLLTMESTPLTTNLRSHFYPNNNNNNNNKHGAYTPTVKGHVDMNLSPIVSTTPQRALQGHGRQHNTTFEPPSRAGADVAPAAPFNGEKFVLDTMELLEQIEQPLDGTYSLQMSEQHKQMQCVMDLAEAEVEMLAQQGDEEQFEHMLAELGKVNTLSEHQLKMQKSLDTIRRRFHRDDPTEPDEGEREVEEQHQQSPAEKVETPLLNQSHLSNSNNSSSSGERLLSRRSRLYDDVNLSVMHGSNGSNTSCNSASFIVQRREAPAAEPQPDPEPAEEPPKPQAATEKDPSTYKLAERRERDRDRFKTIKISKEMRLQPEIIVPCIDDELQQQQPEPEEEQHHQQQFGEGQLEQEQFEPPQRQGSPPGRLSRRDQNSVLTNNNNNKVASNYLTYKKPKEKALLQRRPMMQEAEIAAAPAPSLPQPRSLSRPRYISGLQKFTTVSKATSAGAGLNAAPSAAMPVTVAAPPASGSGELKSPMGIKSKSFHNLSSTLSGIGGGSAAGAGALPRPSLGGGLRRPGAQPSKLMGGMRGPIQPQEDDSVFKVPKLVSGLRAPGLSGAKRVGANGLARPSSGYYSLSVKAPEAETPESLSSASSRGSLYGHSKDNTSRSTTNGVNVPQPSSFDTQVLTSKLTQVTTGSTGIPKPSGLRPPSQMKRSGLPRPSSIVRR
ncbi:hypothetical protein KR038_003600 [Drosophila bunnanda]|nr:hypothetical protein KR038_003600 [Drosophila bunnanda]